VTIVVSPSANAAFYIAWMLVNFLFMLPASLSTVLFAIASAAPEIIAEKLRFVLRLSVMIGLPAMVLLAVCANFALGLFGANYAHTATIPLLLLIVTYIPELPKSQYIAVCRATNKVTKAATVLTIAALAELGGVVIGGRLGGLDGLTLGYLCVTIVEGIVTAPTVLRAAYDREQQRRAATEEVATPPAAAGVGGQVPVGSGYLHGQQLGLATLITLASAAVSQGHSLDTAVAVWRTGSIPILPLADGPGLRAATEATRADLLGRRSIGPISGRPAYRGHQQAGLDALIALTTPASSDAYLQLTAAKARLRETAATE
jgi:hypothetical protein